MMCLTQLKKRDDVMVNFMCQLGFDHWVPSYFIKYSGCVCVDIFNEINIWISGLSKRLSSPNMGWFLIQSVERKKSKQRLTILWVEGTPPVWLLWAGTWSFIFPAFELTLMHQLLNLGTLMVSDSNIPLALLSLQVQTADLGASQPP